MKCLLLQISLKTQQLGSYCCSGSHRRDGEDVWFPSHSVTDWRLTLGHLIPLAYQMAQQWYVTAVAWTVICMWSARRRKMKPAKTNKITRKGHTVGTNTAIYVSSALSLHPLQPRQLLIISTLSPLCCLLCSVWCKYRRQGALLMWQAMWHCCVLRWVT